MLTRIPAIIVLISVWLIPAAALCFETDVGGYLNAYEYVGGIRGDDTDGLTTERGGVRFQLSLSGEGGGGVSFYSAANFDLDMARALKIAEAENTDGMWVYLVEAYMNLFNIGDFLSLRVGKQYIFWSKAEFSGPLDYFCPWNYGRMSAEKENFREAVFALKAKANILPNLSFQLALLPFFAPDKMPFEFVETMAGKNVVLLPDDKPEKELENIQVGAMLTYNGTGFDFSLAGFRGFTRSMSIIVEPEIYTKPSGFIEIDHFDAYKQYGEIYSGGFNAEIMAGPVNLVLESAYVHTEDSSGDDVFTKNPYLISALGCNFSLWKERITFSLQAGHKYFLYLDKDEELNRRIDAGMPTYVLPEPEANQYEFVGRLTIDLYDETIYLKTLWIMRPDINGVVGGAVKDQMLLPFIVYNYSDSVKLYLGTVQFFGDEMTTFGRIASESMVFAELKYSF